MGLFIDTNVLIDILMPDRSSSNQSRACVDEILDYHDGYISAISINNIQYITRKYLTKEQFQKFYMFLDTNFTIVELTKTIMDDSIETYDKDFEDQIQIFSADSVDCEIIITNDISGFVYSSIPVLTPQDFLNKYSTHRSC